MQKPKNMLAVFMGMIADLGGKFVNMPGTESSGPSDRTLARKMRDEVTRHPLNSKHYRVDWHGSVRRNFNKPLRKKVRSRMKRLAKRQRLEAQISSNG